MEGIFELLEEDAEKWFEQQLELLSVLLSLLEHTLLEEQQEFSVPDIQEQEELDE